MTTICQILEDTKETALAIDKIVFTIPCFYSVRWVSTNLLECKFHIRQEDATFVENVLAPLV